jgi:Zn-dependent M28 family amino/carboxypeptidase
MLGSQHKKIVELLKGGKEVKLTIDIKAEFKQGPFKVYNVIAELPGTEKPDELVIVGGHIDSWDGATGTTDNGTGVSTTLEAARLLTKAGAKPKRTIRFMLWSGEEQGLLGSRAYIKAHPEETPRISAVLVHDGGTNYVSGIHSTEAMAPVLEKALEPLLTLDTEMKFAVRPGKALPFGIGSDHDSYLGVGVPGFHWIQSGRAKYPYGHHTQHDTYELAIPEYQRHTSVVVAIGALRIADLPDLLPRAGLRALTNPKQRMIGVELDDMMQIVNLVKDGAAEKAGVKVGDKLMKFNGKQIEDTIALRQLVQTAPKESKLIVQREGKDMEIPVTLPD